MAAKTLCIDEVRFKLFQSRNYWNHLMMRSLMFHPHMCETEQDTKIVGPLCKELVSTKELAGNHLTIRDSVKHLCRSQHG